MFGEILKVLFNITINISQEKPDSNLQQSCDNLIFILRHMLIKCKEVSHEPKKLQNNIINMLINLPYQSYNLLYWQMPKKEAKEMLKDFEADKAKNKHPTVYEVCVVQKRYYFLHAENISRTGVRVGCRLSGHKLPRNISLGCCFHSLQASFSIPSKKY